MPEKKLSLGNLIVIEGETSLERDDRLFKARQTYEDRRRVQNMARDFAGDRHSLAQEVDRAFSVIHKLQTWPLGRTVRIVGREVVVPLISREVPHKS